MKKIFRLALVFALVGASLVYTGCTKDYSEEINTLNSKVDDQDSRFTQAINDAKALASAAATKAELVDYAKLTDLTQAINDFEEKLDGGYDGNLQNLADEIKALNDAVFGLESEEGLEELVSKAQTSINELLKLFDQIQSVTFVPRNIYTDADIVFTPFDLGYVRGNDNFKHGAELALAKAKFQVFPAEFAEEVGTKYIPEALVVEAAKGVKTNFEIETNVIRTDAETGIVEVSFVIVPESESWFDQPNLNRGYALALKITEPESYTEIASAYCSVEQIRDEVELAETAVFAKDGSALYGDFRKIQLLYDDQTPQDFFNGATIAFKDDLGNLYTKAEIEAMLGGRYKVIDETWVGFDPSKDEDDEPLTDEIFAIYGEPYALSEYFDGFDVDPVNISIACDAEEAAEWLGAEAWAGKYIGFADAAAKDTSWLNRYDGYGYYGLLAEQTAEIVPSYAAAITFADTLNAYWNYQNWFNDADKYGFTLAFDNSLDANVAPFTNADGTDFCAIRQFCGFLSEEDFDYLYDKGNGEISAFIGTDGTPNHRFDEYNRHYGFDMAFNSKSSIAAKVYSKQDFYWPKSDKLFYAVWAFLPDTDNYLLVIPVKVYTQPDLGRTIVVNDTIAKFGDYEYVIEDFIDSLYTEELEDALIRGAVYDINPNHPTGYTSRDFAEYCFWNSYDSGIPAGQFISLNKFTTKYNGFGFDTSHLDWDWVDPLTPDYYPTDYSIDWSDTPLHLRYADELKFRYDIKVFGIDFELKVNLKVEAAPEYKFGFIESDRITVSESGDTATFYAPLQENGLPETVYLNQAVRFLRAAGISTEDFAKEAGISVKVSPVRESYNWIKDTLGLKFITISVPVANIPVQKEGWAGDTLKSWIYSATNDLEVTWTKNDNLEGAEKKIKDITKVCKSQDAFFQFALICDGKGIDTVTVRVLTDDPFKGEKVGFEGGHIYIDASGVADKDITMKVENIFDPAKKAGPKEEENITIFDSVKVYSIIGKDAQGNYLNYLPEKLNKAEYNVKVEAAKLGGKDVGKLTFAKKNNILEGPTPEPQPGPGAKAGYEDGYLWAKELRGLGVTVYCAAKTEWKSQFGALVDNPTNWAIDFENGQITLKKGSTLTEDINITIPVAMTHRYSTEALYSTVTVTFKK